MTSSNAESFIKKFLCSWPLCLVLLLKVFFIIFLQARYSSDYPLTSMLDNDGAAALKTLDRTTLINSNGFFAYGPLYYRVAHVVNGLGPDRFSLSESIRQEYLYFSLILVSTASVLFSFYFSLSFFNPRERTLNFNLSMISFLFLLLVTEDTFRQYLLLPHPDYLQGFFLILTAFWGATYTKTRDPWNLFWAFTFLGFSLSTKLSSIYFIPSLAAGLLVSGLRFRRKSHMKLIVIGFAVMGLAYLLIGIPQNFKFKPTLHFLVRQRTLFQGRPTSDSIAHWFYLLFRNLLPFLPLALLLPREFSLPRTRYFLLVFFALPFLFMTFTLRTIIGADYYIFPFVFLGFFVFMVIPSLGYQTWRLGLLTVLTIGLMIIPTPAFFSQSIEHKDLCRAPVKNALKTLKDLSSSYDVVFLDALTPEDLEHNYTPSWGLRTTNFDKPKSLFFINWSFGMQFFGIQDEYRKVTNPHWDEHLKLYTELKKSPQFVLDGIEFKKLVLPGCNLEIWEAVRM